MSDLPDYVKAVLLHAHTTPFDQAQVRELEAVGAETLPATCEIAGKTSSFCWPFVSVRTIECVLFVAASYVKKRYKSKFGSGSLQSIATKFGLHYICYISGTDTLMKEPPNTNYKQEINPRAADFYFCIGDCIRNDFLRCPRSPRFAPVQQRVPLTLLQALPANDRIFFTENADHPSGVYCGDIAPEHQGSQHTAK